MPRRFSGALVIGTAALLFAGALGLRASTVAIHHRVVQTDDRYYLPPAGWLRAFSLGYNETAADLVWVKTLVFFGERMLTGWKDKASNPFTVSYLSTAAELDPRFRRLYTAGNGLTLFQHGEVTKKSVLAAIDLLERGVREFPDDGLILFELGFMHYFEMRPFLPKDEKDPKTRLHREQGARLIRRSALFEGAPMYAGLLASSLLKKEGLGSLVVEHLQAMLAAETNPSIRESLILQLRKAMGQAAEEEIAATARLQANWRAEMPYLPFDLYCLLDPAPSLAEVVDPLEWSNRLLGIAGDGAADE